MHNEKLYKTPFWAENSGFLTGRDPLGIQNSSIATYAILLPGMTNLTMRIRYYGFYCWLLNVFYERNKNARDVSIKDHYNFIRRAELALAFLMTNNYDNLQSIVGSQFANKNNETFANQGFANLNKGADKYRSTPKGSVYWDFESGALGQYYAGSLINLELIEQDSKIFVPTSKGVELAQAFENSIQPASSKFLQIIDSGVLYYSDLNKIESFALHIIPKGSAEWVFYNKIMHENDGTIFKTTDGHLNYNRVNTINEFICFVKENGGNATEHDFLVQQYYRNYQNAQNDISFSWYYFFLNEAYHFSLETIFWGMLVYISAGIITLTDFIDGFTKQVAEYFQKSFLKGNSLTVEALMDLYKSADLIPALSEVEEKAKKEQTYLFASALAFKNLIMVSAINQHNIESIKKFENLNYLSHQQGRFTEVFDNYITKNKSKTLSEFVSSTIKTIINQHINVAFRKMGNGESNLLKFTIEDNFIAHIQTMGPKHTSPRLKTLRSILTDLGHLN